MSFNAGRVICPIPSVQPGGAPNFADRFDVSMFTRARNLKPDGQLADPRPQGAAAYSVGRHVVPHWCSELSTVIEAWAVPATGKFVMKDLNTQKYFTADLPQD